MQIGRLESVPLWTLWPNEARDFTIWLEENIEFLSQAQGIDLSLLEWEGRARTLSVDLVTEDDSIEQMTIEHQLERTEKNAICFNKS
jgi:hypothetical protein